MGRHTVAIVWFLIGGMIIPGCSGITQYVSEEYPKMIEEAPFRADYPIAREIRYTLYDNTVMNGKSGKPLIATNEVDTSAGKSVSSTPINIPGPSSGTRWSEIYAQKASDARSSGRHDDANFYNRQSKALLETEMAMDGMVNNVSAMFAVYSGTIQVLAAVAQAWHEDTAMALAEWAVDTTRCVADSAPRGSVLHIEAFKVLYGKSWHVDSEIDFIVKATLEDGKGGVIRSVRNARLLTYGERKDKADAEKGFAPHSYDLYAPPKFPAWMKNHAWAYQYAVLINSAIADLYARIEELGR